MKLITKEIEKAIAKAPIYSKDGQGENAEVIVKFFYPYGVGTWLVVEGEKLENGDYEFFGYVDLGYGYEAGYFMLSQLESIAKANRYGLGVERDLHAHGTVKELM